MAKIEQTDDIREYAVEAVFDILHAHKQIDDLRELYGGEPLGAGFPHGRVVEATQTRIRELTGFLQGLAVGSKRLDLLNILPTSEQLEKNMGRIEERILKYI